jgi:molybdopterin-containing oxidoreductase family membrane subunit
MWVERFLIVVPSMATPQVPFDWGVYQPTWVEWSITAASFAAFALLYAVFSKVFPIVSMWEVREESQAPAPAPSVEGEVPA